MKEKQPFEALKPYLPANSFDDVLAYIYQYHVQLTITRKRQSKYGDYKFEATTKQHKISVNGDLNPYNFLITLLHEIAHLVTWLAHSHRVAAHGKEWKQNFSMILKPFVQKNVFPADVKAALQKTLTNAAASTCADVNLKKALHKYDVNTQPTVFVDALPVGAVFKLTDGKLFEKVEKLRTRIKCKEVTTGKMFLFPGVYEIKQQNIVNTTSILTSVT